jgi:hypothetical protein
MHIMQVIRHSPESCPLGNPKKLEVKMNWLENVERLSSKHGIKVLGVWTDRWGHTSWAAFETPNMETFTKFELEPENLARVTFNHIETIVVTSKDETLSFFTQYKKQNP